MSNQIFYISGNKKFYLDETSGILVLNNLDLNTNKIINTTYSNLTGLKATSSLLSGQLYRISDFVLKWNNQSINDQTVKTGISHEPLIVTAISNSKISHIAQSQDYPQDTIYYNIDATSSYSWGSINNNLPIPKFKGWIYRRIDNLLNIDMPYDWRNITVNCCRPDISSIPNYSGNYQYNILSVVKQPTTYGQPAKLYYSLMTGNSGNALSNYSYWSQVSDFVESGTYFPTDESYGFKALYRNFNFIINLPILTGSRIQQPTFTSSLTSQGTFSLSNVKNIKINGGYSNIILGSNFYSNTIGDLFFNNIIGLNFNSNTILNNFHSNVIGDNFGGNTIENNFTNNTLGSITNSDIGSNFNGNLIGGACGSNNIGDNFYANAISSNMVGNTIATNFNSNTIGTNFDYNTISHNFYSNKIGRSFSSNNIVCGFGDNIIGNNCYFNNIANDFSNNNIKNSFYSNTIGNNFNSNIIGSGFYGNTSESVLRYINFLSATHVYNTYPVTLFKNSSGIARLRYFNSGDQLVVTNITE
jgi:hypothetical protein